MTENIREQFEQRYPAPEGCCWNAEQGRYVLFRLKLCTVAKYERFVENWVCWQASREAVVVELPSEDTCRTSTSKEEAVQEAYNHALGECRAAIEAQGLKVAP